MKALKIGAVLWLVTFIAVCCVAFMGYTVDTEIGRIACNVLIGLVVLAVVVLLCVVLKAAEDGEQILQQRRQLREELKQYAHIEKQYDIDKIGSYKVLVLNQQMPQFADAFFIEKDIITPMHYNPEKYIYTSATVGGITTGGIDKVGGNYVEGKAVDSGRCILKYWGEKVQRIQLNDELFKKAQNSIIEKYLNDKMQIVVEDEPNTTIKAAAVLAAQATGLHSWVTQDLMHDGYPSEQKCREIISWICECDAE